MGNTLDQMGEYVQTKYKKLNERMEHTSSQNHKMVLEDKPAETDLVQTRFLGDMLWDIFDVITFGLFEKEKKHDKIQDRENKKPKP